MHHSGPREGLANCGTIGPWFSKGLLEGVGRRIGGTAWALDIPAAGRAHLACPCTREQPLSAVDRSLCSEATHCGPSCSPFPPQGPVLPAPAGPAWLQPTEALVGKAAPAQWETEQLEPSLGPQGGAEPIFPRWLELLRPSVLQAGDGAAGSPASMARPWAGSNPHFSNIPAECCY